MDIDTIIKLNEIYEEDIDDLKKQLMQYINMNMVLGNREKNLNDLMTIKDRQYKELNEKYIKLLNDYNTIVLYNNNINSQLNNNIDILLKKNEIYNQQILDKDNEIIKLKRIIQNLKKI